DKENPAKILYQLLVQRKEKSGTTGSSLELTYALIGPYSCNVNNSPFRGEHCIFPDGTEKVSITGGNVMISPAHLRGYGLGTYLQDEVVRWARQWPGAAVRQISLSKVDATPENEERRDRFYAQFNIKFKDEQNRPTSVSTPMRAGELTPVKPKKWQGHLEEIPIVNHLHQLARSREEQEYTIRCLQKQVESLLNKQEKAEKHPIKWASRVIMGRYYYPFIGLSILVLLVALVTSK
ncbi:MAG TPA: hypothetical protein DIS96_08975, partial [Pusillimonas sp.]|nr:hypothetical protein [Pusillimonas sp.]